jgi:two-component system NtrC family sensor kinase
MPPGRGRATARAILTRAIVYIPDIREDSEYQLQSLAQTADYLSLLAVPMLHEGAPIGAITVSGVDAGAFSERQIELLKTFAAQAVIAIENVRLFKETKEALEQQTATAEILRVIASSPTDIQPVFDAVAQSAARFCGATDASIWRLEGQSLRLVAVHGTQSTTIPIGGTIAVTPGALPGRVVLDRQTIHVEDIQASDTEFPETQERARLVHAPSRTLLATPRP